MWGCGSGDQGGPVAFFTDGFQHQVRINLAFNGGNFGLEVNFCLLDPVEFAEDVLQGADATAAVHAGDLNVHGVLLSIPPRGDGVILNLKGRICQALFLLSPHGVGS